MADVNSYRVVQLSEQSTTSTTFVDVPSTTLTFTPNNTSEIWMIFVTGICRSSSTSEQSMEMRLTINGIEEDLWGHQNLNSSTPNGAGFLIFDRITGTTAEQTVAVQFRAIVGTCYATTIRLIAARLPSNSDFQYMESNSTISSSGSNLNLNSLTFTPTSSGNYIIFGSIKHRETPGGSTSQAWFEGSDAVKHPDNSSNIYHSNARASWNPASYAWRENLTAVSKTFKVGFTSSNSGSEASEHRYRKLMAFREDAFDGSSYDLSASESSTTASAFQLKNSLTVSAPPMEQEYLIIQNIRIGGNDTGGTKQKSGELRIGGSTMIQTNHRINRPNEATQGYHHTASLVEIRNESTSITYDNGFLSPNADVIYGAESVIIVLRYAPTAPAQTHQMIL